MQKRLLTSVLMVTLLLLAAASPALAAGNVPSGWLFPPQDGPGNGAEAVIAPLSDASGRAPVSARGNIPSRSVPLALLNGSADEAGAVIAPPPHPSDRAPVPARGSLPGGWLLPPQDGPGNGAEAVIVRLPQPFDPAPVPAKGNVPQ